MNAPFLRKRRPAGQRAQSFVEFAIFLPILLIMVSGLAEFGFLLNEYLNVMDGPREAARWAVDSPPFTGTGDNPQFYVAASNVARSSVMPIQLDGSIDDIVISVFSVKSVSGVNKVIARYPSDSGVISPLAAGEPQYAWAQNQPSRFSSAEIEALLNPAGSSAAPPSGLVLIEIFYHYNHLLSLPWITIFVPDPLPVHSYTIMPLPAAEPN